LVAIEGNPSSDIPSIKNGDEPMKINCCALETSAQRARGSSSMPRSLSLAALILVCFSLPARSELPAVTVVKVEVSESCFGKKQADLGRACIGDLITLTTSAELQAYLQNAVTNKQSVTLFLNGNDTSISAESVGPTTMQFRLDRNTDNKKIWAALLRDPFHYPSTRFVEASIGLAGGVAVLPGVGARFTLVVAHWDWYATAWLTLLAVMLVVFGWLAWKRDILRDGPRPAPFSLGRTQMAWWFFLIVISYVMIWLISGDRDTITPSLLVLMGISAATALGAVLIDTPASATLSQAATDRLALQAAKQNAQQNMANAQATVAASPDDPVAQKNLADAQAASAVVDAKLLATNNIINGIAIVPHTRGFFRDLLSDAEGTAALHRFQIFVWTIVLGIIFVVSVLTDLSMPEFSSTLLATMGISAGTYLGFKFPEK
jgi:hypothetical protein